MNTEMGARTLEEIDADLKRLDDKVSNLCREFEWLADWVRKMRDQEREERTQ